MKTSILVDFEKNVYNSQETIEKLQEEYIAKTIENDIIQEQFRECREKVLNENEYYAESDSGMRILNCDDEYLMSPEAFSDYQEKCLPYYIRAGLADSEGYYTATSNTENELIELKDKIIRFAIDILPDNFTNKDLLIEAIDYKAPNAFNTRDKIFDLFMRMNPTKDSNEIER